MQHQAATMAQSSPIHSTPELLAYLFAMLIFFAVYGVVALLYGWWKGRGTTSPDGVRRWPTAKVERTDDGAWCWKCWYCGETSVMFPAREAAQFSADQHTDHVERRAALS